MTLVLGANKRISERKNLNFVTLDFTDHPTLAISPLVCNFVCNLYFPGDKGRGKKYGNMVFCHSRGRGGSARAVKIKPCFYGEWFFLLQLQGFEAILIPPPKLLLCVVNFNFQFDKWLGQVTDCVSIPKNMYCTQTNPNR